MAITSNHVTADVIEAQEFPDLSNRYAVYGVPKTVVNESVQFEGAQPEPAFIRWALSATGQSEGGTGAHNPPHPPIR